MNVGKLGISLSLAAALAGCASMSQSLPGSLTVSPMNSMTLHQDMRRLWADHVNWTRDYIIEATANTGAANTVLTRLMQNQVDIGNAIKPYYGDAAGNSLTNLLKQHIAIAGDLVAAAMANDAAKQADADRRWHANAADLAGFLAGANPTYWPRDVVLGMLNNHLALTGNEAVYRLHHDWANDTPNFDKIFSQAMDMADALSDGITKQFPTRF